MMFKALILQAQHNLSDARMEFMIRDPLSWMRFLGLSLGDRTPDENTIRHFRNRLTETEKLKRVMYLQLGLTRDARGRQSLDRRPTKQVSLTQVNANFLQGV